MVARIRDKENYGPRWPRVCLFPRHQVGRQFEVLHRAPQVPLRHWTAHVSPPSLSPLTCDKRVIIPYLPLGSTRGVNAQEVLDSHLVGDTTECEVLKERELLTQQNALQSLQRCYLSPPSLLPVTNAQPCSAFGIPLGNVPLKAVGFGFCFSGGSTTFFFCFNIISSPHWHLSMSRSVWDPWDDLVCGAQMFAIIQHIFFKQQKRTMCLLSRSL